VICMIIRGIHYGLTLLYSYLLPLFKIEETHGGFTFTIDLGPFKGLKCRFNEFTLETTCSKDPGFMEIHIERIMGLEKHSLFKDLCKWINVEKCIVDQVSLIYEPAYKNIVAYSVYLSRNTNYYINTLKWVREAIEMGVVDSTSFIPREFNRVKREIDHVLSTRLDPISEALSLMKIRGFGVKSANAYLLHAYGLTQYAPIDRHYARLLNTLKPTSKATCLHKGKLQCSICSVDCPYRIAHSTLGEFNGVVQSLVYIHARLSSLHKSQLEKVLVADYEYYRDIFENILHRVKEEIFIELGAIGETKWSRMGGEI
jgi:hypothetical protein